MDLSSLISIVFIFYLDYLMFPQQVVSEGTSNLHQVVLEHPSLIPYILGD